MKLILKKAKIINNLNMPHCLPKTAVNKQNVLFEKFCYPGRVHVVAFRNVHCRIFYVRIEKKP